MFRLLLIFLLAFVAESTLVAAPQSPEDLQKQLQAIESSPMPADAKNKARERIMKQMQKAGGKGGPPKKDEKKGEEKKGDDKKDGAKKEEDKSATVKRPDKPKEPADPKELEARPTNGKLVLRFRGHPWPDMIDWYSKATDRDVQWLELPNGFVNVATQNAISMAAAGDVLNRLLLEHGFTMLDDGDFLQVAKVEGINQAIVPRVEPRRLETMMPFSFARTSFQLRRVKAEDLVKELEAMKSKHGKLTAMPASNRIEAMDLVVNLRDIYNAIDLEQSSDNNKPREFVVRFVRAELIKEKLGEMLGSAGPAKPAAPMTPQQMQQMQRQQQQMAQKNKGKPPAPAGSKEAKISMIVNEAKNSIIVKAPPHKMLDIVDAIDLLDVRPSADALDIKSYTLATRSPQEVADMLKESGALSPTSIVRVDKETKTLLVSGTEFDHFRVGQLVKTIDGNARRFVSVPLRRYPAVQVAATIEKMMGEPKEEKSNRRRYYYSYYNNDEEEKNPNDKFQVAADAENNRLILKCNDAEYEMVMELLTQMGEVMTRSRFVENSVVLEDVAGGHDQDELLRRVKAAFEAYAPNKVVLPPPQEKKAPPKEEKDDSEDSSDDAVEITKANRPRYQTMYTQVQVADARPAKAGTSERAGSSAAPPPIVIERNAQGKIVIRSKDPKALEMFEALMREMAPKNEDWVSFRMVNVSALWMRYQLEDFFEEDDDDNSPFQMWYWGGYNDNEEKSPAGLGTERKMRFIDDSDRTLVVRNASPKQLATIRQLIALYDTAEPPNENQARYKRIIPIKFSKARVIETALKDAFRDLLSSNDKAFEQKKGGEDDKGGSRRFYNPFYSDDDDKDSGLGGSTFKGRISFGVDESTNTLIVTAQGKKLLEIVSDMVETLDKAAVPSDDTRVMAMPSGLNSTNLRTTLTRMFGESVVTTKPNGNPEEGQQEGGGEPNGEGRKGRGRQEGRDR